MGAVWTGFLGTCWGFTEKRQRSHTTLTVTCKRPPCGRPAAASPEVAAGQVGRVQVTPRRSPVLDLVYIGLTIVVFGVLWLIVKGVEHFER